MIVFAMRRGKAKQWLQIHLIIVIVMAVLLVDLGLLRQAAQGSQMQ
jgi:hypothetical protein